MDQISYDPRHPWFPLPAAADLRFAVEIFTDENVYGLAPAACTWRDGRLTCTRLAGGGQQFFRDGQIDLTVREKAGHWTFQTHASLDGRIKCLKLILRGLPAPALEGGLFTANCATDEAYRVTPTTPFLSRYPHGVECFTPWLGIGGEACGVSLSVRDTALRAVRFGAWCPPYLPEETLVEITCEEDARLWSGEMTAPEIVLQLTSSAMERDAAFADHLRHIEALYRIPRWEDRTDIHPWARRLRLVLNLHGQHWTGHVFNTFDRMGDAIEHVANLMPGDQILAYLAGWEGRYYWQYPHYRPGPDLGGDAGFSRLLHRVRRAGAHVMPMFGANGVNAQIYPDWTQSHFRDRTNRRDVMINMPDWDGDRAGDDDQLFMNPGEPRWRQFLSEQISRMVEAWDLDTVYLDTTAAWFNDPRHNVFDGYLALRDGLRSRHPGLMLVGEGFFDAMWAVFPINQTWMGIGKNFRYPEIVTRYGRAVPYLAHGTPGLGSTGVHEWGWRPGPQPTPAPGHLPCLGFVGDTLENHPAEIEAACRMASTTTPH